MTRDPLALIRAAIPARVSLVLWTGGIPWGFIGSLVLFAVIMAGTFLLLRFFSGRGLGRQGRFLTVLDRFPISKDCQILVIRIGERVLAVCVGREGGSLLCELDPADLKAAGHSESPVRAAEGRAPERSGFWGRFWHNIRLNAGLMPKGTKPMGPPPKAGDADTQAFADILAALQQQGESAVSGRPDAGAGEADYRAAVENMRQLAQTDRTAPAARTLSPPSQADGDTARELLRVLEERRKETAKPAHTNPGRAVPPEPSRSEAIDGILDSIAKRQSRYAPGKPGGDDKRGT